MLTIIIARYVSRTVTSVVRCIGHHRVSLTLVHMRARTYTCSSIRLTTHKFVRHVAIWQHLSTAPCRAVAGSCALCEAGAGAK